MQEEESGARGSPIDRLSRNLTIFLTLLTKPLTMFSASLPHLDLRKCSVDQKCGLFHAALDAHLEGLRIGARSKAVMPDIQKAMKLMGGQAHDAGPMSRRKAAVAEAMLLKSKFTGYVKKGGGTHQKSRL